MMELFIQIFQLCIIPLLGILTKYLVDYLSAKRDELNAKTDNEMIQKYVSMISQTITNCVIATNQTYVNSLKEQGKFDEEAQKEALEEQWILFSPSYQMTQKSILLKLLET